MSARAPTSTPWVGSSAIRITGSDSSAREMTTFCWLPPESATTGASIEGAFTDSEPSDRAHLLRLPGAADEAGPA